MNSLKSKNMQHIIKFMALERQQELIKHLSNERRHHNQSTEYLYILEIF